MSVITPELVERMVTLVRKMDAYTHVTGRIHGDLLASDVAEAQDIAAELPEPIDPDLIEARKLVAERYRFPGALEAIEATLAGEDDHTDAVKNCMRAIKRGRELAGGAA